MKKTFPVLLQKRITFILIFLCMIFGAVLARLFVLQVVRHQEYVVLAASQHRVVEGILPERGSILARDRDRSPIPLALNKIEQNLVASPRAIKDTAETAQFLAEHFSLDESSIVEKLSDRNAAYRVLAKRVDPVLVREMGELLPKGVFFEEERRRVYLHGATAAHVLGFVSKENTSEEGRYGLERSYEGYLSGGEETVKESPSVTGMLAALGRRIVNPPVNGADLFLTIDANVQQRAEEILAAAKDTWGAPSGAILVTEPATGKILAVAAVPVFDPNEYTKEKDFSVFLNPLVSSMFELGSVMKPLTMAGGLEEGLVRPETTYNDTGSIPVGKYTIRNFDGKPRGVQTMTQVLEKSLNMGAVFVARKLGAERQLAYLKKFGLGERTGIDLPTEATGNISNLKSGREVEFLTASFGQGIAVTPIQMAMAMGAIANGGKLMRPMVVERIQDDSGNEIAIEPAVVRQVISPATAETLTKMLVSAVRAGIENKAGVKGYFVAGKTGTAQIPLKEGRGYSSNVTHTFVGYAPAFQPRFLVYLQLNELPGNTFATQTLTPAFHDFAEFLLNYYEIPPDEKISTNP